MASGDQPSCLRVSISQGMAPTSQPLRDPAAQAQTPPAPATLPTGSVSPAGVGLCFSVGPLSTHLLLERQQLRPYGPLSEKGKGPGPFFASLLLPQARAYRRRAASFPVPGQPSRPPGSQPAGAHWTATLCEEASMPGSGPWCPSSPSPEQKREPRATD